MGDLAVLALNNGHPASDIPDVHELLPLFVAYQLYRGFSPATIKRRSTSLGAFGRFLSPRSAREATTEQAQEFLSTFRTAATRYAYRADLAAFYRWAHRRDLVKSNPLELVDPVKVPKTLPRPVPADMVPALITACSDPDVQLMVALAAYAGLRRAEIATLSMADVTHDTIVIRNGKGAKDRMIPLHPRLRLMLAGRRGQLFDVSKNSVGRRVAEHLRACGVDATCHQLRHTFGTELARLTHGDLLLVGSLMGHECTDTTKGYTAFDSSRSASAVAELYQPPPAA